MRRGTVIQAAPVSIPNSGRPAIRLLIGAPYEAAGERAPMTGLYIAPGGPSPADGDLVEWSATHVFWHRPDGGVVRLRKLDYAFNPDAPLH